MLTIRMDAANLALYRAFALSLLLHALVLAAGGWLDEPEQRAGALPEAQFEVTLRPGETLEELQPPLFLEESPPPVRKALAVHSSAAATAAAALQPKARTPRELFYPPEAIARGLEGQALVRLSLDASGNAVGARLEVSSGHALLDNAALRAAKTLRGLPESMPREALLPVRFRLR